MGTYRLVTTLNRGRTKIEVGPTYNLKIGTYYSVVIWKRKRLSNLMPMVVKIVGSTPTARTINESEVVSVLDTEQNKQYKCSGMTDHELHMRRA